MLIETCPFLQIVGDQFCDDEANYEICEFDGGDCCMDDVFTLFCIDCECIDPNQVSSVNTGKQQVLKNSCALLSLSLMNNIVV